MADGSDRYHLGRMLVVGHQKKYLSEEFSLKRRYVKIMKEISKWEPSPHKWHLLILEIYSHQTRYSGPVNERETVSCSADLRRIASYLSICFVSPRLILSASAKACYCPNSSCLFPGFYPLVWWGYWGWSLLLSLVIIAVFCFRSTEVSLVLLMPVGLYLAMSSPVSVPAFSSQFLLDPMQDLGTDVQVWVDSPGHRFGVMP